MLTFIGLGLCDEKDITLKGLEEAKNADKIFIELYTSNWKGNLQNLEKLIGKKIDLLSRKDMEDGSNKLLEMAKTQKIAIFVLGDPLVATTHTALILEARKNGIDAQVIHNASIISAICETGLHLYKFGPPITIPFPERTKGKPPESVYETIKMNRSRGLHTLCLLDVIGEENRYMNVNEGIGILLGLEDERKEGVFSHDTAVIVFSKAGWKDRLIIYSNVKDIIKKNIVDVPSILIIPGILHFTEKEYLSLFCSE